MNIKDYDVPYYSSGNRFYSGVLYSLKKEKYEVYFSGKGNILFNNNELIKYPFNLIYKYG